MKAPILRSPEELADDARWESTFATSAEVLERLAAEALEEYRSGLTEEMGFDQL